MVSGEGCEQQFLGDLLVGGEMARVESTHELSAEHWQPGMDWMDQCGFALDEHPLATYFDVHQGFDPQPCQALLNASPAV